MSVREINRQYEHWMAYPPPSLMLARISAGLGIPLPEAPAESGPFEPTSIDELRAMGASFGIGSKPPWEVQ